MPTETRQDMPEPPGGEGGRAGRKPVLRHRTTLRGEPFLNPDAAYCGVELKGIENTRSRMSKPSFRFSHYDLQELRAGTIIEVTLSAVNNVRLMTPGNFQRFKETLDFKYLGGVAKKSPIKLTIPESGHWHLIVDMEGHHGLADSSVKTIVAPHAPRMSKAS